MYRSLDEFFSWSTLCNARRRVSLLKPFNVAFAKLSPLPRFDLEYPVECDEEYWETPDPEKAFQQPPGKPCKMSCFIWLIKLAEMLGFAHRTLYATKKSKMLIGLIGNEWESEVVSELDSSMNKWKDSLPQYCETFAAFKIIIQGHNLFFQCAGTRQIRMLPSFPNLLPSILLFIISRYRYTDHSL